MKQYDVAIVGGGVTGGAIARELSHYKLDIVLFEKEEELAFGVSKSNSGIIHPGTQNPPDSLKGRLSVQGNALTKKISRELGVDFKEVGSLIVAFDEKDISVLTRLKREAEILGVPRLKIVKNSWLRKNEPNLNPGAIAALHAPSAGIISPYRLVYDLCENAKRNGVEFYTGAKVENIARLNYSGLPEKSVFEISTGKGVFKARYIINAAGLFADEISAMVGVSDFKIKPRKGEEFLLDKKREHLANHVLFPVPSLNSKGILVIKTSDGNPMIGPTAHETDDKEDFSTSEEGLREVFSSAKRLIPALDESDIIAYFAGLRPASGHDFIIRHEEKAPGFVNVAGIQSPGLTAAPAIALMAARLLKRNGLRLKRKFIFHRHRRKESHLFSMPLAGAEKLIKKDPGYGDIVCRCEMVSAREIEEAIEHGATTLDGIKFRTRAQAGRCHGGFCTTRIMRILERKRKIPITEITKRGRGSEIVKGQRKND